jgi:hypothetical protein
MKQSAMGEWRNRVRDGCTSVANLDVLDVASDLDGLADNLVADAAS